VPSRKNSRKNVVRPLASTHHQTYPAGVGDPNHLLRDLRHTLGLTQQGLVERLQEVLVAEGVNAAPDVRLVTAWESGATAWPHPHYRRALRTVFGVSEDAALGFRRHGASTRPRVLTHVLDPDTEDPVRRQTFLTGLTSVALGTAAGQPLQPWLGTEPSRTARPSLIGATDVAAVHGTAEQFSAWDKTRGGAVCTDAVLGQLNWASTLLDQGRFASTAVRAQMCSAVSHLAQVAGMSAYDAGLHPEARRALALAVHAATEADDQPLRAFALASMARQALTLNQTRQALDLTALAFYGLSADRTGPTAPAALRSLLHGATARAHGRAGDAPATMTEVAAAEDAYAPPGPDDPAWLQFYQPAHVAGDCGNATFDAALRRKTLRTEALHRLATAATGYGPQHPRSAAFCRARAATLHLDAGNLQPAVDEARAFTALADGITSARLREDRAMLARHAHPHRAVPDVADLVHALTRTG
jgi:transcriptional regulator with XRE-family HTH domain